MISNADCTILTRSVNDKKQYIWNKKIYHDVYFETSSGNDTKEHQNHCYCCIYDTSIDAKIEDIIIKGIVFEDVVNITDIKKKYPTFSISKVTICDIGNIKHTEIEGF